MDNDIRLAILRRVESQNEQLLHALESIAKATTTKKRIRAFAKTVVNTHRNLRRHLAEK